jgi:hypothetical protein
MLHRKLDFYLIQLQADRVIIVEPIQIVLWEVV